MASWSHSILAELGRLQALASDKAKGSFISSISHELRSPLHGILAGLEFLEETELTAFQLEMAHTIRTAGKALLDTVRKALAKGLQHGTGFFHDPLAFATSPYCLRHG